MRNSGADTEFMFTKTFVDVCGAYVKWRMQVINLTLQYHAQIHPKPHLMIQQVLSSRDKQASMTANTPKHPLPSQLKITPL